MTLRRAHLSGRVLVLLGVVLLVAAIGHPRVAQATCGGVYAETVKPPHRGVLPPLAIGDSTLILSVPTLKREGISANAQGCRQYSDGLVMLNTLRRQGRLARVVIVALGANGPVTESEVTTALADPRAPPDPGDGHPLAARSPRRPRHGIDPARAAPAPRPDRGPRLDPVQQRAPRVVPAGRPAPDVPRRGRLRPLPGSRDTTDTATGHPGARARADSPGSANTSHPALEGGASVPVTGDGRA